jgi:hypothetical protein
LIGHSNRFVEVALIVTSLGGFALTPSDLLAILYPEEYIRRAEENGNFGHIELIYYIWRRLRD